MTSSVSSSAVRRHDLDALRVFAFALLILYHTGMAYVAEWDWHVKSSYIAGWLQYPMLFVSRWRMDLLFLISGAALALLTRRGAGWALIRVRTHRLLLPLLFGMAVVVPLQPYCQGVRNGLVAPGFGTFLLHYWPGSSWPAKAFDGWEHGYTWNHLWYLAYLWVYTLVWLGLRALCPASWREAMRSASSLRGGALLLLPALPLIVFAWALQSRFPNTNDLVHDWFMHAQYFTVFVYGWRLADDPTLWEQLRALRHKSLFYALACFAGYLALIEWLPDEASVTQLDAIRLLRWFYCWLALATVLGHGAQWLNRPFRWLPYATEAVYPWYMLHQTLIVGLVFVLAPMKLGAVIEPALVLGGTIVGCALLHEGIIRRVDLIRPLFGLKPIPRRRSESREAINLAA